MQKRFLYVLTYNEGLGANGFGSAQRSEHLLKAIQQVGTCDVVLLHVGEEAEFKPDLSPAERLLTGNAELLYLHYQSIEKEQPMMYKILKYAAWRLGFLHSFNIFFPQGGYCFPEVRALIDHKKYDSVILRYFLPGVRTGLFQGISVPLFVDVDDSPLELVTTNTSSVLQHTGLAKLGRMLTSRWMKTALKQCSYAWWVRDEEVEQFANDCPCSVLQNIPVFPSEEVPYEQLRRQPKPLNVLFVGYLSYAPNIAGLLRFLEHVWPRVVKEEPDAVLNVVGKGANDGLLEILLHTDGVSYHGFQENLLPFYKACTLAVCPIYQGAGSKIKVLEALAYNRPVVLTEHALDGLKCFLGDSQGILSAESDSAFCDAIVRLQREPDFAVKVASAGLKMVEEYFSVAAFESQVITGFMTVGAVECGTENSLVSIIIPAYNAEHYLSRAIDSALGQRYPKIEVIVVDDGSTDTTGNVCAQFGDKVKYIRQDNAGVSAARNRGINASSGEYIAFLDADDWFLPNKLSDLIGVLQRHPRAGGATAAHLARLSDKEIRNPAAGIIFRSGVREGIVNLYEHRAKGRFLIHTSTVLVRRSVLEDVGMFREDLHFGEDVELWARISGKYDWGFLDELVSVYDRTSESSVTTLTPVHKHGVGFLYTNDEIAKYLRPGMRKFYRKYRQQFCLQRMAQGFKYQDRKFVKECLIRSLPPPFSPKAIFFCLVAIMPPQFWRAAAALKKLLAWLRTAVVLRGS